MELLQRHGTLNGCPEIKEGKFTVLGRFDLKKILWFYSLAISTCFHMFMSVSPALSVVSVEPSEAVGF